jgi:DNA-binding MarR family transcriptional regulator
MPTNTHFISELNAWAEVFMGRSMHDMVQFTKDAGISMPQLSTLMHLHHRGACGVTDIGEHLGVTSAAASQMIDRMVQQGLLERSEDANDRRAKQITVTEKSCQLIEKSVLARQRWMEDLTTALTPQEQEQIVQALKLLTRAARQIRPQLDADHLHPGRVPQVEVTEPQ